jgi:4-amino-4-deoxy-L-arabinose transferase-like glycosyltransferase
MSTLFCRNPRFACTMSRLFATAAPWLLIVFVAIALRCAAAVWWQARLPDGQQFGFGDSQSYWELGRAIARGGPYQIGSPDSRVFRTPGYPILLAPLFWLEGPHVSVMWGRALSAALGGVAAGGAAYCATRLFNRRAGLVAGWFWALYPGAVAMGALVLSETLFCPLMLLELALWGAAWRSQSRRRAIGLALASGIAAGAATLVRPGWLLFTPFAVLVGLVLRTDPKSGSEKGTVPFCSATILRMVPGAIPGQSPPVLGQAATADRSRHLRLGLLAIAALMVSMTPWWIRNALVIGHFVPTTLQVGASLYDGLNPRADGSSNMQFVDQFAQRLHQADARAGIAANYDFEFRLDRQLREAAISWAVQNPGRVIELASIKFVRLWNVWPNEPALRNWPLRLVVMAGYLPLLLLGLYGAWRFTPQGWPYILAWLPAVYVTLLHVVFVGSIRYREPAMLALAVLAAGATSRAKYAAVEGVAPL